MLENGLHERDTQRLLTKLIKFVLADRRMFVNIDA